MPRQADLLGGESSGVQLLRCTALGVRGAVRVAYASA